MNKFVMLGSVAAFVLSAGAAGAVTIQNTDKDEVKFSVEMGGKKEHVMLKQNESFDSKGKDLTIHLHKEKPVMAKADEQFIIKGGKLEAKTAEAAKSEPAKLEDNKPAAGAPEPAKKAEPAGSNTQETAPKQ